MGTDAFAQCLFNFRIGQKKSKCFEKKQKQSSAVLSVPECEHTQLPNVLDSSGRELSIYCVVYMSI